MNNIFNICGTEVVNNILFLLKRGRHGRDRMVAGFTPTSEINSYPRTLLCSNHSHDEVYSIQQCGFLPVAQFPPPIKLTSTI